MAAAVRLRGLRWLPSLHLPPTAVRSTFTSSRTFHTSFPKSALSPSTPFRSFSSSSRSRVPYLLVVPLLIGATSATLFLESEPPVTHSFSLDSIHDSIDEPKADEFLRPDLEDSSITLLPDSIRRVLYFLSDYVLEPLSTTRRFIHLALLFLPVLITAPVLLLELLDGSRDKRRGRARRDGERTTTTWWYRFLVGQMERAGPTFIKVSCCLRFFFYISPRKSNIKYVLFSSHNGQVHEQISSPLPSVFCSVNSTQTVNPTRSATPSASSNEPSESPSVKFSQNSQKLPWESER